MKILYYNSRRKSVHNIFISPRKGEWASGAWRTYLLDHPPENKNVLDVIVQHISRMSSVWNESRDKFSSRPCKKGKNIFFCCGFCLANDISKDDGIYNAMSLQIRTLLKRLTTKTPSSFCEGVANRECCCRKLFPFFSSRDDPIIPLSYLPELFLLDLQRVLFHYHNHKVFFLFLFLLLVRNNLLTSCSELVIWCTQKVIHRSDACLFFLMITSVLLTQTII